MISSKLKKYKVIHIKSINYYIILWTDLVFVNLINIDTNTNVAINYWSFILIQYFLMLYVWILRTSNLNHQK